MTSELEKQFFDTFEIEPVIPGNPLFCEAHCKDDYDCDNCRFAEYPKLTNLKFLELICLCPDLDDVFFTDVGQLKETLLTSYIKIYKYYTEVERLSDCGKELKQQVQALFKEYQ